MKSKEYFVALLSSYINEVQPPEFIGQDADWNMVLYLAEIHSVQTAVYIAVSRLKVKPPNFDVFKEQFCMCVNVSVKQEYCMQRVINALTENNIKHTIVKGYVLKNYYKNSEARSLGDVDILINEYDRQKSDEVLKGIGLTFSEEHSQMYVWTYCNKSLSIEVHTKLAYQDLINGFDYDSYFSKKCADTKLIRGCTYCLNEEEHFLFIMEHMAKHFNDYGIGIRMIMDIAVFFRNNDGSFKFDYVIDELKKIKLYDFAQAMFAVCNKFFGTNIKTEYVTGDIDEICLYILDHGVFGLENKNIYEVYYHKNDVKDKNTLIKRIFLDYETMKKRYFWFRSCPKILLPYGWIRRFFIQLTNKEKRNTISAKISAVSNIGYDSEKHNKMLKAVGLK